MSRSGKNCCQFLFAFFICELLTIQEGTSQYYLIGTDPASVRWSQIITAFQSNLSVYMGKTSSIYRQWA